MDHRPLRDQINTAQLPKSPLASAIRGCFLKWEHPISLLVDTMKLGTRPGAKEQTPAFKWATGFCITQCKTGSDVNTHDYPIFCQEAKAFHQLSPWNIQKRHLTFTSLQRAFPSLHKELYTKLLGQLSTVSL